MEKLAILEKKYDLVYLMDQSKVEKVTFKKLEDKYNELKGLVASLSDLFAHKKENKEEHDTMSANLANLYELLINHNHRQAKDGVDPGADLNEIFHCSGCEVSVKNLSDQ